MEESENNPLAYRPRLHTQNCDKGQALAALVAFERNLSQPSHWAASSEFL